MESPYTLNIKLTDKQLEAFGAAGSRIVIAKPNEGGGPKVAWQVLRPMNSTEVRWEEQYGIYASSETIKSGAYLTQMSNVGSPAGKGTLYALQASGAFKVTTSEEDQGSYYAINQWTEVEGPPLAMGLYQNATINGVESPGNAVSVAKVDRLQTIEMTPYTTLYVWRQSEVRSNTVVSEVTSEKTKVTFGGKVTSISLGYDSANGIFVTQSGFELGEGASVESSLREIY